MGYGLPGCSCKCCSLQAVAPSVPGASSVPSVLGVPSAVVANQDQGRPRQAQAMAEQVNASAS